MFKGKRVSNMFLYILLGLFIALCLIHNLINNNHKARQIRKIPGLADHFLIGNAWHVLVPPVELFRLGREFANTFNGIYKFYAYPHAAVNIYNPEDIEIVISTMKHHEKSDIYKFMRPWLRDGLLLSSGQKWQQRRKVLTSAFHFNVLRQYFIIFGENTRRLIETLVSTNGQPTNVVTVISEYTLNSICESAMGTRLNTETSESAAEYKNAIHNIGNLLLERFVRMYLYSDFIFNHSTWGRWQAKILSVIHNFTKYVIKQRKSMIASEINIPEITDNHDDIYLGNKKKRTAMLDLLIAAEREGVIDDVGIQEEVDTFMFEGHDTTAAGLALFLMVLANNPAEQMKVVEELEEIFGNSDREATMDDLSKMAYLERCIKESLRLYPPVPFISRRLCDSVKLSNYTVPEGTFCHIHIYDLHRRADLFKDPLKFDPDRFLPEKCLGRHNFAYIPFSAGPRNCIGQKFAMLEMKLALSNILRNFELAPVTTPADIKFKSDLILRNSLPIYVRFIERP